MLLPRKELPLIDFLLWCREEKEEVASDTKIWSSGTEEMVDDVRIDVFRLPHGGLDCRGGDLKGGDQYKSPLPVNSNSVRVSL